jgi:hypothetical protein
MARQSGREQYDARRNGHLAAIDDVSAADVMPKPVEWEWKGRIPKGKLTIFDGDPDIGKSVVTMDIAARKSTGRAFPDGASCKAGNVLICNVEDGMDDNPRVIERRLQLRFINRKDVDVNVLEMCVEFYKEGSRDPLAEPEAPYQRVSEPGARERSTNEPLNLPSRKPVRAAIRVWTDTDAQRAAMEKVSRARFVAKIDGALDKRKRLHPPWKYP